MRGNNYFKVILSLDKMSQVSELFSSQVAERLGSSGLAERLSDEDKEEGILNCNQLIELVKNKSYARVQGIGDDFLPDTDLYNAIGAIYPFLDRVQRDNTIKAHLEQFDHIRYDRVNWNHTPFIREPLLLADITLARRLYWPGLHDEESLWKGKTDFSDLQKEIMTEDGLFQLDIVHSDFLVAYGLMRSDFTPFGEDYVKSANPNFLNRVLKGIVALRFGNSEASEIESGKKRLYTLLPKSVHDRIEPLMEEKDWTDYHKFN